MGSLHELSPREMRKVEMKDAHFLLLNIKKLAEEHKIEFIEAAKVFEILESARRTTTFVDNGDAWDEQISGIGKILERIADNLDPQHK